MANPNKTKDLRRPPLVEREVSVAAPIDPLLRLATVLRVTGLSRSQVYRLVDRGEFPRPVRPTAATVAWGQSAVASWIDGRPEVAA